MTIQERFIRLEEVIKITGLSKSSIYAYMRNNYFPKNISLSKNTVAWLESEVNEWMLKKIDQRNQKET